MSWDFSRVSAMLRPVSQAGRGRVNSGWGNGPKSCFLHPSEAGGTATRRLEFPKGSRFSRNDGYSTVPFTRTVDVHVANLRRKLEDDPAKPSLILTVHGLGYKFIAPAPCGPDHRE